MNLLDMHTREKVNKIHLTEMHRDARHRYPWSDLNSTRIPAMAGRKIRLVLISLGVVLLLGIFLISAAVFLILRGLG